jgi:hypothetical protein
MADTRAWGSVALTVLPTGTLLLAGAVRAPKASRTLGSILETADRNTQRWRHDATMTAEITRLIGVYGVSGQPDHAAPTIES